MLTFYQCTNVGKHDALKMALHLNEKSKLVTNLQLLDSDRQQKQERIWCETAKKGQGVHGPGRQGGACNIISQVIVKTRFTFSDC